MKLLMTAPGERECELRRIQLWLGDHLISDWIGDPGHASRYEAAMRRLFRALRMTNESVAHNS
ncbi:hypothetical protein E0H73_08615 [Kribbella pittospori]|uniref:Uncharacterized protein n=1 Tax=Kribbella pittospori TaxID=722689 RepID=A0A4R0KV12_9ACTN|nr:hypothetical protein [Kribbella pittospori]TCC64449.1 hypothetical protein E0H73_08615 [Kribbella pittospori]